MTRHGSCLPGGPAPVPDGHIIETGPDSCRLHQRSTAHEHNQTRAQCRARTSRHPGGQSRATFPRPEPLTAMTASRCSFGGLGCSHAVWACLERRPQHESGCPQGCMAVGTEMSDPPRRFGVSPGLVAISSWSDAAGEPSLLVSAPTVVGGGGLNGVLRDSGGGVTPRPAG